MYFSSKKRWEEEKMKTRQTPKFSLQKKNTTPGLDRIFNAALDEWNEMK